jgi:hypothetical protein
MKQQQLAFELADEQHPDTPPATGDPPTAAPAPARPTTRDREAMLAFLDEVTRRVAQTAVAGRIPLLYEPI